MDVKHHFQLHTTKSIYGSHIKFDNSTVKPTFKCQTRDGYRFFRKGVEVTKDGKGRTVAVSKSINTEEISEQNLKNVINDIDSLSLVNSKYSHHHFNIHDFYYTYI